VITDLSESDKKDFTVIKTSENKDLFNEKLLTADVFESSKKVYVKNIWNEAQDIEITLDFITYGSNLVKKIISKVLPKL